MTPDVRPKQRLNEVVGIPDKPDDLNILIEWKDPIIFKHYPKGTPRKLTFVCSVEWAWSPMNNRIANYYINPKPWGWVLWDNMLNDHDVPWNWWWNFLAYTGRTKADERTIAAYMLMASWKDEAEDIIQQQTGAAGGSVTLGSTQDRRRWPQLCLPKILQRSQVQCELCQCGA